MGEVEKLNEELERTISKLKSFEYRLDNIPTLQIAYKEPVPSEVVDSYTGALKVYVGKLKETYLSEKEKRAEIAREICIMLNKYSCRGSLKDEIKSLLQKIN